jgi:hypothetical protein
VQSSADPLEPITVQECAFQNFETCLERAKKHALQKSSRKSGDRSMALGTDHCTSVHLASLYMLTWYFEGAVLGTTSSACTSARDTANYWRNTANLQPENCAREPLKPPNVHSRFPVATSKSRVDNPTPSLVVASMWSPLGENEIAGLPFSLLQRAMYAAIQSLRNICPLVLLDV